MIVLCCELQHACFLHLHHCFYINVAISRAFLFLPKTITFNKPQRSCTFQLDLFIGCCCRCSCCCCCCCCHGCAILILHIARTPFSTHHTPAPSSTPTHTGCRKSSFRFAVLLFFLSLQLHLPLSLAPSARSRSSLFVFFFVILQFIRYEQRLLKTEEWSFVFSVYVPFHSIHTTESGPRIVYCLCRVRLMECVRIEVVTYEMPLYVVKIIPRNSIHGNKLPTKSPINIFSWFIACFTYFIHVLNEYVCLDGLWMCVCVGDRYMYYSIYIYYI